MQISGFKQDREEGPVFTHSSQEAEGVLPHFTKERVKLQYPGGRRPEILFLLKHCSLVGVFMDVLCQPAT